MPKVETAFDLYTKMLLGMAIVFQMPTAVFFLAKMGLVSARFLWSNIKYAILIIFILAAVLTPVRRSLESDRVRGADDRPLPAQHRYRLDGGACASRGTPSVGLQQPAELAFGRIVGRPAVSPVASIPIAFLLLALHLDDRCLPSRVVRLRQDPETSSSSSSCCAMVLVCKSITELYVIRP